MITKEHNPTTTGGFPEFAPRDFWTQYHEAVNLERNNMRVETLQRKHQRESADGNKDPEDISFGPIWGKESLAGHLIDMCGKVYTENLEAKVDFVTKVLINMVSRLRTIMGITLNLEKPMRQKLFHLGDLSIQESLVKLRFGKLDSYAFELKLEDEDNEPGKERFSMRITNENYSLSKDHFIAEAKGPNEPENEGGWEVGSVVHKITLSNINSYDGPQPPALTLEIGRKPNSTGIWSKLLYGDGPDSLITEERHPLTNTFSSLGISYPESFTHNT
jgi:hypothetical protein